MLAGLSAKMSNKGAVLCLGEPLMDFSFADVKDFCKSAEIDVGNLDFPADQKGLTAKKFFTFLGFEQCIALDVSDYEGAEIVHDLNEENLSSDYYESADLIIDAGTLEHVFHLPNALNTIFLLLRPGGMVYHHSPSNGYLDHGFYQFSPTLFYDYYRENNYKIISANLINRYGGKISAEPYLTDIYRNKGILYPVKKLQRCTLAFLFQKTVSSTWSKVPTQTFYRRMHNEFEQVYENEYPFEFERTSLSGRMKHLFPNVFRQLKKWTGR